MFRFSHVKTLKRYIKKRERKQAETVRQVQSNQPTLLRGHDSLGKMSLLNSATMLNRLLDNKPRTQLR